MERWISVLGMVALIVDVDSFEGAAINNLGRGNDPNTEIMEAGVSNTNTAEIEAEAV